MRTVASASVFLFLFLVACSKPASTPPETTQAGPTEPTEPVIEEGAEGGTDERAQITAAACEEQGGTVVGDIGDGAIHRPEYTCPDSGEAPLGTIVAEPGGAIAVEGAVCCK